MTNESISASMAVWSAAQESLRKVVVPASDDIRHYALFGENQGNPEISTFTLNRT